MYHDFDEENWNYDYTTYGLDSYRWYREIYNHTLITSGSDHDYVIPYSNLLDQTLYEGTNANMDESYFSTAQMMKVQVTVNSGGTIDAMLVLEFDEARLY